MNIVGALSDSTGLSMAVLQRAFGKHMLTRFIATHPVFFENRKNALELLDAIENEVHVEVRKLYPDAELPTFETEWLGETALRMTYRSQRPLAEFCHGLIEGCIEHFGGGMEITREPSNGEETVFHVAHAA